MPKNSNHIVFRKFRAQDAKAVKALITGIMDREFREDQKAYPADDLEDIPMSYGRVGEAFFVAEKDGKLIGTVAVKRDDDRHALLRRFFVDPKMRGQKIGKGLLELVVTFCREVGYQEIMVKTTTTMKRAIKVCHDAGFTEKAKIDLGGVQLCKLTRFIRENSPLVQ